MAALRLAIVLSIPSQVYQKVHVLSPGTIFLVIASGIVSAGYNFIQYTVVQSLSATMAAIEPFLFYRSDGFGRFP